MKFFSFLKPKKDPWKEIFRKIDAAILPNKEEDIDTGTKELARILNDTIDYEKARNIFIKSIGISRLAENFNKERLIFHLDQYCLQFFTDEQVEKFYNYLVALKIAWTVHGKTVSEVSRKGDGYIW